MNILRITIYTLIAMIFCIHSTAASEEVNPKILSTVQYYYDINLAKNKGCNWYQVLTAFGHEPDTNPLGCSTEPYTAAQASNKPWSGWEPVRDELARLESLRAEQPQQNSLDSWVQADNDRQDSGQAVIHRPRVWVNCGGASSRALNEAQGVVKGGFHTFNCRVYTDSEKDSKLLKDTDINYRITDTTTRVKTGNFIFNRSPGATDVLGGIDISWENDNSVSLDSKVTIEILPGKDYTPVQHKNNNIIIYEDDREVRFLGVGCTGKDSISGTVWENDGEVLCHLETTKEFSSPVTINYSISETGVERLKVPNAPLHHGTDLNKAQSFTFPANQRTAAIKLGAFLHRSRQDCPEPEEEKNKYKECKDGGSRYTTETSKQITWTDDNEYKGNSLVTISLLDDGDYVLGEANSKGAGDYVIGTKKTTTFVIKDDDTSKPRVSIDRCSIGSDFFKHRTVFYEGYESADKPFCFISSTAAGWPNENNPLKMKVTKSGSHRNLIIINDAFTGLNDIGESATYTQTVSENSRPVGTSSNILIRNDVVNSGSTYLTFEILPSEHHYVAHPRKSIKIEIRDDDTDPQDIQIGFINGDKCDTTSDLEIDEDGSTELCVKVNGYDRYTYLELTLDQDEGGFIDNNNNPKMVKVTPADPNGTRKHLSGGIYAPVRPNNDHGKDGSVRITLKGSVDGQYNSASKKAVVKNTQGFASNQIFIEYQHDPTVKQDEHNLSFKVYPPHGFKKPLKIDAVYEGYRNHHYEMFNITKRGQEIKLNVNKGDQVDKPLDIMFGVLEGDYTIVDRDKDISIAVTDSDPTCFSYSENTLGTTLEEGSFTKIAQWKIESVCEGNTNNADYLETADDFKLTVKWGLDGCKIVDEKTSDTRTDGPFECYLNMPGFTREGLDTFHRGNHSISNGFSMELQGGNDLDTDDEIITFDPEFIMNSGGGFRLINAPKYLIAYDRDDPTRPMTHVPVYVEFTIPEFQVVEDNGPSQPVVRMYHLDSDNRKNYSGLTEVCNEWGKCEQRAITRNRADFYVKVEGITAKAKEDYISDEKVRIVYPAGIKRVTEKFDIGIVEDKIPEGEERIRVSIIENSLPRGFFLREGDVHQAIVRILDDDGACTGEACLPTIEVVAVDRSIGESNNHDSNSDGTKDKRIVRLTLRSNKQIPSRTYTFTATNYAGNRLKTDPHTFTTESMVVNGDKTVSLEIPNSLIEGRGTNPGPDGVIRIELQDASAYKKINSDEVLIDFKDGQRDKVLMAAIKPSGSRTEWTSLENDQENKFIVGPIHTDDLIPIEPHQAYTTAFVITHPDGTTDSNKYVTNKDYELVLDPVMPNMSLQRQPNNVYLLKVSGVADTDATYDCNGQNIPISGHACIRYVNKHKNRWTINDSYIVNIRPNKPGASKGTHKYMDYTTTPDRQRQGSHPNRISNQEVKPLGFTPSDSPAKKIKIVPSYDPPKDNDGYITVNEPKKGRPKGTSSREQSYNDYRFEVVIDPPPAKVWDTNENRFVTKTTEFQLCFENNNKSYDIFDESPRPTTWASYYADYRVMDEADSLDNRHSGGRAFNRDTGCTFGSSMNTAKKAFYLRVHHDPHGDSGEKIHMYVRVKPGSPKYNPDNVSSGTTTSNPIMYVIQNDDIIVGEYLARSGHAKAAHIVDIVKGRVSQPAGREPSVKIVPGGSPGDTDPDVILEGAIIEATTRGGITIYTDLSRLNFSGDVGLNGDIKAITIGADKRWENHLLGVGFTTFKSHGEYTGGKLSEKSWAAYPYGAYYSHRLTIYGLLAFGEGSMILNPNTHKDLTPEEIGADTTWRSYALGLEYRLFENERISSSVFIDHFDQTNKSKTVKGSMEDAKVSTYRTRAGLDTTLTFSDSFSSTFTTSFNKDSFEDVHLSFGTSLNYQMNEKTNISARWNKDGDFSSYGIGLGYTIAPGVTSNVDIDDSGDTKVGVQGNLSF